MSFCIHNHLKLYHKAVSFLFDRFLYEDGIRDYCSAYTGSSAKMPIVADRLVHAPMSTRFFYYQPSSRPSTKVSYLLAKF